MAPVARRLRRAAACLPGQGLSIQDMARAHGPEAPGTLLLLMAAPCLLPVPGVGTVLGLGLAALAFSLWRGQADNYLPRSRGDDFMVSHALVSSRAQLRLRPRRRQ